MTDSVGDDNAELDFGDDDEGGNMAGVIPEDERVMPPLVETIMTDEHGARSYVDIAPWIYVEATRDLPGWDLWSIETDEHATRGWIPNNEEGANAIALGWARLIDVPEGLEPPPDPPRAEL